MLAACASNRRGTYPRANWSVPLEFGRAVVLRDYSPIPTRAGIASASPTSSADVNIQSQEWLNWWNIGVFRRASQPVRALDFSLCGGITLWLLTMEVLAAGTVVMWDDRCMAARSSSWGGDTET